jgi:hypothetical protein
MFSSSTLFPLPCTRTRIDELGGTTVIVVEAPLKCVWPGSATVYDVDTDPKPCLIRKNGQDEQDAIIIA